MTAFCFGGSPVPSIKVGPTNTVTVSLQIISWDKEEDDESVELFWDKEDEIILLLDSCREGSCMEDTILGSGYKESGLDAGMHNI